MENNSQYGKVKGETIIFADEFVDLLDKFIRRSESWKQDAEGREDWNDWYYYKGQKEMIEELKNMISNFK